MAYVLKDNHPDLPPPRSEVGVVGWLRRNLFSTWYNSLFTLVTLYLLYRAIPPFIDWALIQAHFSGTSRASCTGGGACWVFIGDRLPQFFYGFYPAAEQWRVNIGFAVIVPLLAYLHLPRAPGKLWVGVFTLFVYPILAFFLFSGGLFGLTYVPTTQWGGLMLTLILAFAGIVAALPLGVLLALGRRSKLPILRSVSVVFIEVWRGVPLITVLFMSSVLLPLFMPAHVEVDKLLRALIAIALFQSAYIAEVVRGGLQAIPKGQFEAADALGLSYPKSMALIVMPQALKIVIPGIIVTFIELFKDTSLVVIIGLMDLLGITQAALNDPKWLGFAIEGYLFAGLIYWIFCFGLSRYGLFLENRFHTGHRR
ncbi:amino acid ABC transporter permease [Acidihalobacter ferrooxydans]|uniref:Amino acid ABC transporter permease n=1 Tax=Acidihalobacter ferrooxydans TaxID=1765967 RepID=A0A1P8UFU9_9GAMM|nr:amino acid ABC transporter permease [Acidihalobacter ferrooxydans]APZ42700.1 amino acid ABC transporter permease [Acidihalobacter ferrooxydans]